MKADPAIFPSSNNQPKTRLASVPPSEPPVRALVAGRAPVRPIGSAPRRSDLTAVWEPEPAIDPSALPTSSDVIARTRPPETLEPAMEAEILRTLTRPVAAGETDRVGNARREHDLGTLFSQLDVLQSHHLGRRLDLGRPTDAIAVAFGRLVVERRQRLRAWLADARRRASTRQEVSRTP